MWRPKYSTLTAAIRALATSSVSLLASSKCSLSPESYWDIRVNKRAEKGVWVIKILLSRSTQLLTISCSLSAFLLNSSSLVSLWWSSCFSKRASLKHMQCWFRVWCREFSSVQTSAGHWQLEILSLYHFDKSLWQIPLLLSLNAATKPKKTNHMSTLGEHQQGEVEYLMLGSCLSQ